jgi:hypothetical protein
MFQSTPITGRQGTEGVTPLPCLIIPLKGEVSNRKVFLMKDRRVRWTILHVQPRALQL